MPELTLFGRYPTPVGPEAMDLPAQMMAFADAIDAHTVLFASSDGDRDARYNNNDLGPGAIVATDQAPWYVWLRIVDSNGNLGWATVYEDTGWQDIPASAFQTGWTDNGSNWRRRNGQIEINYRINYTGESIIAPASGNVLDSVVLILPSAARPRNMQIPSHFVAHTCGNLLTQTNGNVSLTHLYPNSTLFQGTTLFATVGPFNVLP